MWNDNSLHLQASVSVKDTSRNIDLLFMYLFSLVRSRPRSQMAWPSSRGWTTSTGTWELPTSWWPITWCARSLTLAWLGSSRTTSTPPDKVCVLRTFCFYHHFAGQIVDLNNNFKKRSRWIDNENDLLIAKSHHSCFTHVLTNPLLYQGMRKSIMATSVISVISTPIPPAWPIYSLFQVLNSRSSGRPLKLLCTAASRSNQTSGRLVYYWLSWSPRAEYRTQVGTRLSLWLCWLLVLNILNTFPPKEHEWVSSFRNNSVIFCLRMIPTCHSESQSSEAFNSIFLTHADEYRTESAQMSND